MKSIILLTLVVILIVAYFTGYEKLFYITAGAVAVSAINTATTGGDDDYDAYDKASYYDSIERYEFCSIDNIHKLRDKYKYDPDMLEALVRIGDWYGDGGVLKLSDLDLTELPPLPSGLGRLSCSGNQLTSLPPLPTTLKELYCEGNLLKSLPPLPPDLEILGCNGNQLTELPQLPPTLKYLYCGNNQLTLLPPLPSTLNILECDKNPFEYPPLGVFMSAKKLRNPTRGIRRWMSEHPYDQSLVKSANKQ